MRKPKLDRRVTLLRKSGAKDPLGRAADDFASIGVRWGAFTQIRDGERIRAGQVEALSAARIVLRWGGVTSGLTAKDRLRLDGREWQISGVKEIGPRRRWIEVTAALISEGK